MIRKLTGILTLLTLAVSFPLIFKGYLPHKALPSLFLKPLRVQPKESFTQTEPKKDLAPTSSGQAPLIAASTFVADAQGGLEPAILFWKRVYAEFDKNHVIFHDAEDLEVIYSILDFSKLKNSPGLTQKQKHDFRENYVQRETERIQDFLKVKKLKRASENVRSQTGLRDEFILGVINSGLYLKEMEQIFETYGLPNELTRLVFVESLFHTNALSHVGAAGLWQFMPRTGKSFLQVSTLIDERYDPILSTHAAAKLLRQNYGILGSWPLAINAYNAGAGRMKHAVKRMGTKDLSTIIKKYKHASYGFASRNFFPEFIAALHIYENYPNYFGELPIRDPLEYGLAKLPRPMTLAQVTNWLNISTESLQELNPSLSHKLFVSNRAFPKGTILRVP